MTDRHNSLPLGEFGDRPVVVRPGIVVPRSSGA